MNPRLAALHRARQRGAAVFVVVLVITLLSALGLFAVKNATLSNTANGYNRQLTQVHYLTEYGLVSEVADLKVFHHQAKDMMTVHAPNIGLGDVPCVGQSLLLKPTCQIVTFDDLEDQMQAAVPAALMLRPWAPDSPGSLGSNNLQADLRIEMTDLFTREPASGFQAAGGAAGGSKQKFAYVTITVSGMVRPAQAIAGTFDRPSAGAAAVEIQRAHVRMGPLQD